MTTTPNPAPEPDPAIRSAPIGDPAPSGNAAPLGNAANRVAGGTHWSVWLALIAGVVVLIASFLNYVTVSYQGISDGINGWSKWWWLAVIVALVAAVLIVLRGLGMVPPVAGSIGSGLAGLAFGLSIAVLIHTFTVGQICQGSDCLDADQIKQAGASVGPGFGVWLALVATAVLLYAAIAGNKRAVTR